MTAGRRFEFAKFRFFVRWLFSKAH